MDRSVTPILQGSLGTRVKRAKAGLAVPKRVADRIDQVRFHGRCRFRSQSRNLLPRVIDQGRLVGRQDEAEAPKKRFRDLTPHVCR